MAEQYSGLGSLSPEVQAQYDYLMPEVEKAVRRSTNARGVFYSGPAQVEEIEAKRKLLTELALADEARKREQAYSSTEREKDREVAREQSSQEGKSAGLSSAMQAAGLMGGLYMTRQPMPGGQPPAPGTGSTPTPGASGGWREAFPRYLDKAKNLAGAGLAGLAGSSLGSKTFGRGGTSGDVGAGVGGAAGLLAASRYGPGYGALAAGAGSFLGRGLGGLMKKWRL